LKGNVSNCEFNITNDPTKILIKKAGLSGIQLSEFLFTNGVEDEKTNEKSTMLLCGLGTDVKKLKKLERVLNKL
jgi:arginine/lysine/ornithine decarboxylase